MMDSTILLANVGGVVVFIVPTIWYLASRIQKLSGVIETSAAGTRERLNNLESKLGELANEIKELRHVESALRERLVVVETKVGEFGRR